MKKEAPIDSGKAAPSSGLHDSGKDNKFGHSYPGKILKREKVVDAKHNASLLKRGRISSHGGNAVKIMPYIPSGADAPTIPNTRGQGHFAIDHVHGDSKKPKKISHLDD